MKNDSVVQTRCKRTTLASLVLWYYDQGERVRSISELTRLTLEGMVEVLKNNGSATIVEDVEDAQRILQEFGLEGSLNPSGRGRRNLYCNLAGIDSTSLAHRSARMSEITTSIKREQDDNLYAVVKQQVENWDKKEKEQKERISDASGEINLHEYEEKEKEELKKIKNALGVVPNNVVA